MNRFLSIAQKDCCYTFLPTGDIFTFTQHGILVNQFRGNAKDGSVNNIYLRIHNHKDRACYPLLGIRSGSALSRTEKSLQYKGCVEGVSYTEIGRAHV